MAELRDIFRGDTKTYKVTFTDADGLPIELFGSELWFTLKKRESDLDADAAFQKQHVFPSDADSTAGIGFLTLTSDDTGAINPGVYSFDFQRVVPGSPPVVTTLTKGKVRVVQDITRANA
jgi:hypothetical protein